MFQICEWQLMQVLVGGMPADGDDFDRGVAVAAVDADAAGVMLVAELHRLLDELVGAGDEIGSLQREDDPAEAEHQQRRSQ